MKKLNRFKLVYRAIIAILMFALLLSAKDDHVTSLQFLAISLIAAASLLEVVFVFVGGKIRRKLADGTLRIDRSNPDKDVYRFEVNTDLESVGHLSELLIVVDPFADLGGEKHG